MRPQPIEIDLSLPLDLPADAAKPIEVTQAYWEKELGYTCEAERSLIRNMAAARVRANRCRAADDAHLALADHRARAKQLADRRKRARKIAQSLEARPGPTLEKLEATQEGRDWLANRWRDLDAPLAQAIPLTDAQCRLAMNLMGCLDRRPGPDAPPFLHQLNGHLLDAQGPPASDADAAAAHQWLRSLAHHERTRIQNLAQQAAAAEPEPHANLEHEAHLADARLQATDPEAQARRKVEHQADQSYARNLSLLIRLRNGRRREREWELKESRRGTPRTRATSDRHEAHQAPKEAPTPTPPTPSAENPESAPQRTIGAPTDEMRPTSEAPSPAAGPTAPTRTGSSPEPTNPPPPAPTAQPANPDEARPAREAGCPAHARTGGSSPEPTNPPPTDGAPKTQLPAHQPNYPIVNQFLNSIYAKTPESAPRRTTGAPLPQPRRGDSQ